VNKRRAWILILAVVVVCAVAVWLVFSTRERSVETTAALLTRLPSRDSVVLFVDFDALRRGGVLQMLAGPKLAEEKEYKSFVAKSGFDYKEDLDSALAAFHPDGYFFLLRGRFDWKRLQSYVTEQQGSCFNTLCRLQGSTPERKISFFPLRPNLMALASSRDEFAASRMQDPDRYARAIDVPDSPVWFSLPSSVLKSSQTLPAGTRMFAKSMEEAEKITISVVPDAGRFVAKLDATCRSTRDAAFVAAQLSQATSILRQMIEREKRKPNPSDLSGVLTAGVFRSEGRRVTGTWPLERAFFETLAGTGQ
jgi:hypothetical protein